MTAVARGTMLTYRGETGMRRMPGGRRLARLFVLRYLVHPVLRCYLATTPLMLPLSLDDLLTRGYFHDRVIPSLGSAALQGAVPDIRAYIAPIVADAVSHRFKLQIQRNRPVQHSVPKRQHLRRILTIPHPLPYAILCEQIEANWTQIKSLCVDRKSTRLNS